MHPTALDPWVQDPNSNSNPSIDSANYLHLDNSGISYLSEAPAELHHHDAPQCPHFFDLMEISNQPCESFIEEESQAQVNDIYEPLLNNAIKGIERDRSSASDQKYKNLKA